MSSEEKQHGGEPTEALVEVIVIELGDATEGEQHRHSHPHVVHIYSEADQRDHPFRVHGMTLVGSVFEEFYASAGLTRSDNDLFKCESTGENLAAHSGETIEHMVESGHCRQLVWIFDNRAHTKHYDFFVDGKKYETTHSALTGAQIKAAVPNFNPAYQLVLEGDPDRVIPDSETVDLNVHPERRFYSVPPATFGAR